MTLAVDTSCARRLSKDIYYAVVPHGLTATLQDQVNADLLAFLQT
jgi:non-heme chloroperoxidase